MHGLVCKIYEIGMMVVKLTKVLLKVYHSQNVVKSIASFSDVDKIWLIPVVILEKSFTVQFCTVSSPLVCVDCC